MNTVDKYPGLQEVLDECQEKAEKIVGKKLTINFSIRFKHLPTDVLATIVCNVCEVMWTQVISDSRKANIVLARHLYCYFAAMVQKKTLYDIANILKKADHTVVIHARDKVKKMIEVQDEIYVPAFNEIEKRINEVME